jgi:TRAP-type C4-dicarboxylate transport system substrate-binding protein
MKFKNILLASLIISLLFTVLTPAEAVIRMRYGHEASDGHPYDYAAHVFARELGRLTNGEIVVDVFANGTLGNQAQMVESLSMGLIDFASTNTVVYEQLVPAFGVLTTPMLFRDYDAALRVLRGPIGAEFKAMVEPHGVKILEWLYMGSSKWNGNFPISHPEDIVGRRIRIQPGRSHTALGHVLNIIITPTSFGEVYAALQLGTIESNLQTIMNVYGMRFYEVAPYFSSFELAHFVQPLSISLDVWNRLSAEHQEAVLEAARITRDAQYVFAREYEDRAMQYMLGEGGLVMVDGDIEAWRTALQPMFEALSEWADYFERIIAYQATF